MAALLALAVARVAAQPGCLRAPVDILIRLPHVFAPAGVTEGLETHGFQRDVAGEDQQVGPGYLVAVFLLYRPQQAARLVQADVVGPAVQRRETLLPASGAAAAVADAIGAGAMPGHANEQWTVMTEIGRPPVLRIRHQRGEVFLYRGQVETFEGLGVIEIRAHGVGLGGMLGQQIQAQLLRPPVAIGGAAAGGVIEWTFRLICHRSSPLVITCRIAAPGQGMGHVTRPSMIVFRIGILVRPAPRIAMQVDLRPCL